MFFVSAETAPKLLHGHLEIGRTLHVPVGTKPDPYSVKSLVLEWVATTSKRNPVSAQQGK